MNADETRTFLLLAYCIFATERLLPKISTKCHGIIFNVQIKGEEFRKHGSKTNLSEVWLNISQMSAMFGYWLLYILARGHVIVKI